MSKLGWTRLFLEAVIKIHSSTKGRLGPFPRGAFEDHAERKRILAAVTPDDVVGGYLLYQVAKNRAAIVHLAISTSFRGKGIARMLVNCLKSKTRDLLGISLRCRRDYGINDMWQGFHFTVRHSKQGRGADGALLDYWWFDHSHDDLFSQAAAREDTAERALTVIDANIFSDLTCEGRQHAEDTRVLQSDWLEDSLVLCVTPEIYNEIHRAPTEDEKKRGRMAAQKFREVKTRDDEVAVLEKELALLFNGATFARDISDMRHVAHAIAAEVPFLVTRDTPMLARSEPIFEKYGLRILHPTDLISRLDMLRREVEYRPARLEGSNWRERLVTADDVPIIVSLFKPKSERGGNFGTRVRHYLVNPDEWASTVTVAGDKAPTVYLVHSRDGSSRLDIPVLRHTDHPLAGTLLCHLIHEMSREASAGKHRVLSITDTELSNDAIAALTDLGFVPDSDAWWKMSVTGIVTRDELISEIREAETPLSLKERFVGASFVAENANDEMTVAHLEHLFSPAKIFPSVLPCYIVSIRQSWAAHFFDIPVGAQTLMDLNEKLHLGIEGTYYCSAKNTYVTAPARVLWYVSGKGSMSVKACSHLEERIVDPPKEVYARFRHLGVYSWKHVLETVDGNLQHPLMAFRFSRTERFVEPVKLAELQAMDIPQPQNPRKITSDQFAAIYRQGMKL